jgi:hypothetical protein
MIETSFSFKFPNGDVKFLTIKEALKINEPFIKERIEQIFLNRSNKRMNKDGFEPGFQQNINEYSGSYGEYSRRLKELGLTEVGNESGTFTESTKTGGYTQTESFVKDCLAEGIELSGNEIDGIMHGDYFDSSKINE